MTDPPAPPALDPWPSEPAPQYSWSPAPAAPARRSPVLVAGIVVAAAVVIGAAVSIPLVLAGRHTQTGAGTSSPSSSAAIAQAQSVYRDALAKMRASSGVHYVAVTGVAGAGQRIVGDAGQSSGTQKITFDSSYGPEQFTLVLSNGVVYFQGNAAALQDQIGVSGDNAPVLSGKWIAVSRGDGPYSVLQPGITVADQAGETMLVPASSSQVTASGGVQAIRVQGTVPAQRGAPRGTGHLDIASATHLPIAYVSSVSANTITVSSTTTFSAWGTAPNVAVPSGAVAWSTLGATPPPGGYGSGGGGAGASSTPQTV